MANILNARELWTAGPVTVTGYHPCQASCASCPGWCPAAYHGPGRQAFTAAVRDATLHAITHQAASA